uniref:Uncharacterized protein n=1 Tax=Anguilla anguilla TaxID=7936 RepID=A0A0E9TUX2_ANGAN
MHHKHTSEIKIHSQILTLNTLFELYIHCGYLYFILDITNVAFIWLQVHLT